MIIQSTCCAFTVLFTYKLIMLLSNQNILNMLYSYYLCTRHYFIMLYSYNFIPSFCCAAPDLQFRFILKFVLKYRRRHIQLYNKYTSGTSGCMPWRPSNDDGWGWGGFPWCHQIPPGFPGPAAALTGSVQTPPACPGSRSIPFTDKNYLYLEIIRTPLLSNTLFFPAK